MMERPMKKRLLVTVRGDRAKQANQYMVDIFGPLAANTFTVSRKKSGQVWYVACGVFLSDLVDKFNEKIKTEVSARRMNLWKDEGRKKLDEEKFTIESSQLEGRAIRR